MKKLEGAGVIVGYCLGLDLSKINMVFLKTQLYLRTHSSKLQQEFKEFCQENKNITYYIQQLGDPMHEIELEVDDMNQ